MTAPKAKRQRLIARYLHQGGISSQEQLRELLIAEGVDATQATLSRDLRDLGVVKGPDGYVLAEDLASASGGAEGAEKEFENAIQSHLLEAEPATHLVVLRTAPGHAQALAVAIDNAANPAITGTIAGDDAIFVAMRSERAARSFLQSVRSVAGLE